VVAPLSLNRLSGVDRVFPAALFQFGFEMTPALSVALMAVPDPTKSMLMTRVGSPFTVKFATWSLVIPGSVWLGGLNV
jgi:hypothetical protein